MTTDITTEARLAPPMYNVAVLVRKTEPRKCISVRWTKDHAEALKWFQQWVNAGKAACKNFAPQLLRRDRPEDAPVVLKEHNPEHN